MLKELTDYLASILPEDELADLYYREYWNWKRFPVPPEVVELHQELQREIQNAIHRASATASDSGSLTLQ